MLGGAGAAWPLAARAQQPAMPVIGFLHSASPAQWQHLLAVFRNGLNDVGYSEGQNVAIEFRWAEGRYERLPSLAADLVGRRVAVITAAGGVPSALAAKAATSTIPIVFLTGEDPVKNGLVASLNRPEGTITGVSFFNAELTGKRLELLRELVPHAARIGLLVNRTNPEGESEPTALRGVADAVGINLQVLGASTANEIDTAFATLSQQRADALIIAGDPFFSAQRAQFVVLAARHAIPAIASSREFVEAGGLMSYGTSRLDAYHQAGTYAGRILKGEKPSDLPVLRATRFELFINLNTAKALALTVPPTLLARADEVIE
jgi:putative ABC transport system substrate-binding protein